MVKKELLDILACPVCKKDVIYMETQKLILCTECSLAFPVIDDIPIMLIEEAQKIEKNIADKQ
jgi:uncharacterized protein YbaR (Trm112 family)